LNYVVVDDQILVGRIAKPGQPLREIPLNLTDLAGTDPAEWKFIVTLVEDLIEPTAWEAGGGPGALEVRDSSLIVRQHDRVLFQVVDLCERLRVARGLPLQSTFDPRLFRLATRSERAAPQLKKPVSLNYFRPTPLVQIVQRMAEETGTHLLVDWRAIARAGWNPDATVTMTVADQPLAAALSTLLTPMELTYRVVDDDVLQITTAERIQETLELELYAVEDLVQEDTSPDDLLDKIMLALGETNFRDAGGSSVIRYDPQSKHLLAALPQTQHHQLAQRLADWRAPAKP